LDFAKMLLSRNLDAAVIELASDLAREQGRMEEFKELVRSHPSLESGEQLDPQALVLLERLGLDVREYWDRLHGGKRRPRRPRE
jgi:hypothetical protein